MLPTLSVRGGPIDLIAPSCWISPFQTSASLSAGMTSVILASKLAVASANFPAWQRSRNCRACSFGSDWPTNARQPTGISRIKGHHGHFLERVRFAGGR